MDRIQRALDISRLQRGAPVNVELAAERAELLRADLAATDSSSTEGRWAELAARVERPAAPAARLALDPAHLRAQRVVLPGDRGPASSAYRMLRAQLLQRARSRSMRSIGIVSAVAGEGKTLTAINLAMSLAAEPNQDVALLDLDLRRPTLASRLGIAPPLGLDGWLTAQAGPPSEVLYELQGIERLIVAPTLAPVAGSSDVLAGDRVAELLDGLRARRDSLLIVDLPPALLSDDVLMLAPRLDGVLVVITENVTRREDVSRVFELLGRERIVGTVLNGSSDSEQRAY